MSTFRIGQSFLRGARLLAFSCVPFLFAQQLFAQTNWDGDFDQDWNNAANWASDPNPPTGNFLIAIDGTGPFPILSANSAFTPVDVIVGTTTFFDGRFDHRAGSLSTGTGNWFIVGRNGAIGVYNLADTSGAGGTLTGFAQGSGSLNVGGTSTTIGRLLVGDTGASVGTVNMNTSGTLKLEDDAIGLLMGNAGTSIGNFNLDGGTLQVNSASQTGIALLVGTNGGDGNLKLSGGTVNATGGVWVGDNNAGSQGLVEISGGNFNATSTGVYGSTHAGQVYIGRGLGQGTLNVSGTANVSLTGQTNVGFSNTATAGTSGVINVSGGTFLNTGEMRVGVGQSGNGVTARASGAFNVSGGTATVNGVLIFARGNDNTDLVTGTGTVSGTGTLNVENDLIVAYAGNANLGQLNINSGGTVNVATTTERWLIVNQWDTSQGQLIVNGGTLNLNTNTDIRFSVGNAGSVGTSSVTLSSGAITSYSGNGTGSSTSGVVDMNRSGGAAANNTFNLDGGTLTISQVISTVNTGTAAFNFNGGTLKAANNSANFVDLGGATQTAVVKAGGAKIDSNGFNVTIPQALIDGGGGGGLTKEGGAGTLTLTAANTYTGPTTISAGTLQIGNGGATGSLASGSAITNNSALIYNRSDSFTVANAMSGNGTLTKQGAGVLTLTGANTHTGLTTVSGGTLAFSTTQSSIGGLTVSDTTGLSVKTASAASTLLTTGNLSLGSAGATTLTFDFNLLNPTAAQISASGLTLNGSITTNLMNTTGLVGGTYTLIDYSGAIGGNGFSSFSNTAFNFGHTQATITDNVPNTSVDLVVTGDSVVWSGAGNQTWVTAPTNDSSGPNDWATKNAHGPTNFWVNDAVEFNDTYNVTGNPGTDVPVTNRTVNISAADVNPTTVIFNNSAGDYTITGSFGIAGASTLVKNGSSKVTLTNANTYTGVTTINSGILELGDGTTNGSIGGNITNDATLAYNNVGSQTYGGLISGTGAVTKNGPGTVIHSTAHTYAGGTTINAGILRITTTAGSAHTGTFNLNGGTFQVDLGAGTNFGYAPTINLTATSTIGNAAAGAVNNLNGQINYTGTLTGNGNVLNVANTGLARLYMNGTLTGLSQINVQSGAMGFDINSGNNRGTAPVDVANGAALWVAGNNANPVVNALTFNGGTGINGGGALYYEGGNAAPAAITSTITLASGDTGIGSGFADTITLSGAIGGSGSLTKLGPGTYRLTGSNTFNGATSVNSGTLYANGANAPNNRALSFTSGITVNNGGTLRSSANALFGWDGTQERPITVNAGGTLTANGGLNSDVGVGLVTLAGGTMTTLAGGATDWGSFRFDEATDKLLVTENSTVSAQNVKFGNASASIDVAAGKTLNFTGTITNTTNGGISYLTKAGGAGILTLAGTNTYTGATSINAGTLTLASTGSINNTPTINIAAGAIYDVSAVSGYTLQPGQAITGAGTVQGNVALAAGADLSPGTSPGTLTFANDLDISLTGGSNSGDLLFELGSSSDLALLSTGVLTIGAGTLGFNDFAFTPGGGFGPGTYTLFQTSQTINGTLDGGNLTGIVGGLSANLALQNANTALVLVVMPVPEPTSMVMLLVGCVGLLRLRARKRTPAFGQGN